MVRVVILITSNVFLASLNVLVDVVLSLEQALGLLEAPQARVTVIEQPAG